MAREKNQAAADQAAAEIELAKEKSIKVEVVLLRDSNLGVCGEVVNISSLDVAVYKAHGFIDDNALAIKHAKAETSK